MARIVKRIRQPFPDPADALPCQSSVSRRRLNPYTTLFGPSLVASCSLFGAESIDVARLPPPAQVQVDFARDIKPLLGNACLKCHSGEKPKGHFLLTDRASALKGGSHGVDIIPGQSANSPLIHYVARLVEDMEMPPEGRGEPLTPAQVGLLRAWIDQGVSWEATQPESPTEGEATVNVGWLGVSGDRQKFRELSWLNEGWNGGLESFTLKQKLGPEAKVDVAGHFLRDDYKLTLDVDKNDLGFARFGWTQFRKYYDNKGGYDPSFSPTVFQLDQELYKDVGRAWTEIGLTLPRLPRMTLGYEYQYRNGTESTLHWGPVGNGSEARDIYPAFRDVDEKVHILKLDADYDVAGVTLADNFRAEWYKLNTRQFDEVWATTENGPRVTQTATEQQTHFQGANVFHADKQFTDWLFASGGYLYSKLNGDASVNTDPGQFTLLPQFPAFTSALPEWQTLGVQLEREAHVFSVSCRLGSWEGLTLSLGTQNEWNRQSGMGSASNLLASASGIVPLGLPDTYGANYDSSNFGQNVALRFTKIPYTTLFAEGRLQEQSIGHSDYDNGGFAPYMLTTDESNTLSEFRFGFNTTPWHRLSLSAHYRQQDNNTDYNYGVKQYAGYPGFILWRDLLSHEAETRLSYQVNSWIRTSLSYRWLGNDYHSRTDSAPGDTGEPGLGSPGGSLLDGQYDAHITSLNATLTPWRRLFFSGTFAFQNARTVTYANGSPSVAPYQGNIYSVLAAATYVLNDRTDLSAAYSYSSANFSQEGLVDSVPLGIVYSLNNLSLGVSRKLSTCWTARLFYSFYEYSEPSSGGATDFTAHGIFATLTMRWPGDTPASKSSNLK